MAPTDSTCAEVGPPGGSPPRGARTWLAEEGLRDRLQGGAALIRGPEPPPRSGGRCRRTEGEGRGAGGDPRAASAKKTGGAHQGGERAGPTAAEGRGVAGRGRGCAVPRCSTLRRAAGGGPCRSSPRPIAWFPLVWKRTGSWYLSEAKPSGGVGREGGVEDRLRQMDNVRGAGGGGQPADCRVQALQPRWHCGGGGGSPPRPQLPSQPARPPSPHYGCAPEFGTGQAPNNAGTAHRRLVGMLALRWPWPRALLGGCEGREQ